jgi:DNA-binding HxlR family transcriptional regulator
MTSFGQYCPVAVALEAIGDRWTLLIVRDLLDQPRGFNELHRCLPRISRTVLTQRLRHLEALGLVDRVDNGRGRAVEYRLTEAGRGLEATLLGLGEWAVRWTFGDPDQDQLDPGLLAFRLSEQIFLDRVPAERTVVELRTTVPSARHWIIITPSGGTACQIDPGGEPDLVVEGDTGALQRWFIGREPLSDAIARGEVTLYGPSRLTKGFHEWFAPATPWHALIGEYRRPPSRQFGSDVIS